MSHYTGRLSLRAIAEVAESLNVRVPSPFLVFAEEYAVSVPLRSLTVFDEVSGQFKCRALIGNTRCFVDGFDVQVWGLEGLTDDYIKPQVDFFALSSNNLVELSLRLFCVNSVIAPERYSQTSAASVSDVVEGHVTWLLDCRRSS